MKRPIQSLLFQIFRIAAQIIAALASCLGCSRPNPGAAKPHELHWHGQDTGFESTTVVPDEQPSTKQ